MVFAGDWKEAKTSRDVRLIGVKCNAKKSARSGNPKVKAAFGRSGCYVFFQASEQGQTGRIYVGQTRYFDTRFNSYGGKNGKLKNEFANGIFVLIFRDSEDTQYNEADLWHLEYLLIDHMKKFCWDHPHELLNKKSGTPSVGKPSNHPAIKQDFDAIIDAFDTELGLSFRKSGPGRAYTALTCRPTKSTTQHATLDVMFDEHNKLFKVLPGSITVAHDNIAHWHHKLIHRRLIEDEFFSERMNYSDHETEYFKLLKPWIAKNISEIYGALLNCQDGKHLVWNNEYGETIPELLIKGWIKK